MPEQYGFDMGTAAFDFGQGQAGFDFSQPESQHSRDERDRRKRHERETAERLKREREQAQREQARRDEQKRQDESRQRRESGSRARCTMTWESACEVLGVGHTASKGEIRKAWAKLARECHPDLHGGDGERLKRANAAYSVLKGAR